MSVEYGSPFLRLSERIEEPHADGVGAGNTIPSRPELVGTGEGRFRAAAIFRLAVATGGVHLNV